MLCQEAIRDPSYAPRNRDIDPGHSEGEESELSRLYIEHSCWLDLYPEFRQRVEATSTLIESTPEFKIYRLNRND